MNATANLVVAGVVLSLPAESAATREQQNGRADIWRVFPGGPAVYAISAFETDGDARGAVEDAGGRLIGMYRDRPGYSRVSRPKVHPSGFEDAVLLDFRWEESHGSLMHSAALVAAWGTRVVVVHGTVPASQPADVYEAMEAVVCSVQPVAGGAS